MQSDALIPSSIVSASAGPLKSKPDKNPTAFDTGCKKHPWHVCLKVSAAPFIVKNGFGAFRIRSTMFPGSCQFGSAGTAGTAVAGSYILLTSHWMCFKRKNFSITPTCHMQRLWCQGWNHTLGPIQQVCRHQSLGGSLNYSCIVS